MFGFTVKVSALFFMLLPLNSVAKLTFSSRVLEKQRESPFSVCSVLSLSVEPCVTNKLIHLLYTLFCEIQSNIFKGCSSHYVISRKKSSSLHFFICLGNRCQVTAQVKLLAAADPINMADMRNNDTIFARTLEYVACIHMTPGSD